MLTYIFIGFFSIMVIPFAFKACIFFAEKWIDAAEEMHNGIKKL